MNTIQTDETSTKSEIEEWDTPETLDDQEDASGAGDIKPWNPSHIRITTQSFTIREVVEQINELDIDISPDFQRDFVWKKRQRARLIESILLGIPLPAFYFDQTNEGTYNVVDGVQRLSSIRAFMADSHRLDGTDLEYLKDLDGLVYTELDLPRMRRFRSTQIVVHVIEPQTPDDVKYDIFSRVNTLGSPLSAQEIRHAMSKPRSRTFLAELAESEQFDKATEYKYWRRDKETGERLRDSGRMTNRELVLRFCAFRHFSESEYRQFPSLDSYLVDFTKRIDGTSTLHPTLTDRELRTLRKDFLRAMSNAHHVLGKAAFRRWPLDQERRGPINRAIFESQANALADHKQSRLEKVKSEIFREFRAAFDNEQYLLSVTVSTGDTRRVKYRLDANRETLRKTLHA